MVALAAGSSSRSTEISYQTKITTVMLGQGRHPETVEEEALRTAANVLPVIREIRRAGATSLHQIADALNARGITTPRGGRGTPSR